MKLYVNGIPAVKGQRVTDFRGSKHTLLSWTEPHKPSSSGRVYIEDESGNRLECYPCVIGAKFRED